MRQYPANERLTFHIINSAEARGIVENIFDPREGIENFRHPGRDRPVKGVLSRNPLCSQAILHLTWREEREATVNGCLRRSSLADAERQNVDVLREDSGEEDAA